MKISVSHGNRKMGSIPSISLPRTTCPAGVPCYKDCYAGHGLLAMANCQRAYNRNLMVYNYDPQYYFDQIERWLIKHSPAYFRYHVSGDIPDMEYYRRMHTLARWMPGIEFLCFTKNFHTVNFLDWSIPANLHIIFSMWAGMPIPDNPHGLPMVWNDADSRRPADCYICSGHCDTCLSCFTGKHKHTCIPMH